jgi:hypothetical protein
METKKGATAKTKKKKIKIPKSSFSIYCEDRQWKDFEIIVRAQGTSISAVVGKWIKDYCEEHKELLELQKVKDDLQEGIQTSKTVEDIGLLWLEKYYANKNEEDHTNKFFENKTEEEKARLMKELAETAKKIFKLRDEIKSKEVDENKNSA